MKEMILRFDNVMSEKVNKNFFEQSFEKINGMFTTKQQVVDMLKEIKEN